MEKKYNFEHTKKKRKVPTVKQFVYTEIVIETGTAEEERSSLELKNFLLDLLSEHLKRQIIHKLNWSSSYDYWIGLEQKKCNVYAKTVRKRKIYRQLTATEKNKIENLQEKENWENEELDEVIVYRTKSDNSLTDLQSFVDNPCVILNISKDRVSIKTPIKKKILKNSLKGKISSKVPFVEIEHNEEELFEGVDDDDDDDYDDDEPQDSEREGFYSVSLEDFIIQKSKKSKPRKKSKVKDCLEKIKTKPVMIPVGERFEMEKEETQERSEYFDSELFGGEVRLTSLSSLTVPVGWRLSYSQTVPAVCEVWSGKEAVMIMRTSEDKILMKVNSTQPFLPETGQLYDICRSLQVMRISSTRSAADASAKELVYPSDVAHRHLLYEEEEDGEVALTHLAPCELSLMSLCDICLSPCYPLLPPCSHSYCSLCWRKWLASPGGRAGGCPAHDCPTFLDLPALHWLAGPDQYTELVTERLDSLIQCEPDLARCSRPRCGAVARRLDPSHSVVSCLCGLSYCALCGLEDHRPASCQDVLTFNTFSARSAKVSKLEVEVEVRACPGCHQAWEKSYGCHHMVCPCGTHFCWGCGRLASLHRGGMCYSVRVPLQTRRIEYLPTELLEIKRIELFKLFDKFHGKAKDFLPLSFRCDESESWKAVSKFRDGFKTILYGLLCEAMTRSHLPKVRRGISSLMTLSELLHRPERRGQWAQRIKSHIANIEALYQLSLNLQSETKKD